MTFENLHAKLNLSIASEEQSTLWSLLATTEPVTMDNDLETFMILKYGSIKKLYGNWANSEVDFLTLEEKEVIVAHYTHFTMEQLEGVRSQILRQRKGIFDA